MSQITLYVDGACRGNPGLGGWGAYIVTESKEHKLFGGEPDTTNNRMELTAAIEGIAFCPMNQKLVIWTDSIYVKRGITEWIQGWKKKNWKDVKNPDLWKKLDATCQNREIEWNWIKGHSGHAGNEMADHLANLGADQTALLLKNGKVSSTAVEDNTAMTDDKKKVDKDWLLDDPFGFDLLDVDDSNEDELIPHPSNPDALLNSNQKSVDIEHNSSDIQHSFSENSDIPMDAENNTTPISSTASKMLQEQSSDFVKINIQDTNNVDDVKNSDNDLNSDHPHIVITPAKLKLQGPRQLILDTETTGFYFQDTDRIIEVGALEMINRKLTGSSIHIYINPKKLVGDSENIHGISDDFLKDKPEFSKIAKTLFEYLKGSEIIAHNATFDMNFLNMEFKRAGFVALSEVCTVIDTLTMAKAKHPGQKNSLDALVRRYEVPQRDRTFHGALLDAEILADVYLAMTGGQVSFDMDALATNSDQSQLKNKIEKIEVDLPVIWASEDELEQHENWVKAFEEKKGEACMFTKQATVST